MPVLLLFVFRFVRLLLSGHQAVAIENAALRMQIAAFQRKRKRPLLTTLDRIFWVTLRSVWSDWRHPLLYVQADTVVRWQRERFRKFWARLSNPQRQRRGRPGTAAELRRLIEQNSRRQSVVARTQDSWRAEDARHRPLRAHRVAHPAQAPAATEPDVAGLPAQPCRPVGLHRFLYRAHNDHEGAVRIYPPGTRSSQGVAFQCDRA